VSVLGEVVRPGVYPYTLHHRLLDLISAASGLSPSAGRLVNVFHRDDARTPHPAVLDPSGIDTASDHNPELAPGDTVQVSRAGLVYVVGDVLRPGGFPVDPAQGLTVVQAISLAWGPTQNASMAKALLIREQKGGRTITTLNLKRMLHCPTRQPKTCGTGPWNRPFNRRLVSPFMPDWFIRRGFKGFHGLG
jgi:polysaccharide export outer membrane protein